MKGICELAHLVKSDKTEQLIWSIKSRLAISLEEYRQKNKLTQRQMAARLGITQPRYSNLNNARFDKFSIDQMIKLNCKVGNKLKTWHIAG